MYIPRLHSQALCIESLNRPEPSAPASRPLLHSRAKKLALTQSRQLRLVQMNHQERHLLQRLQRVQLGHVGEESISSLNLDRSVLRRQTSFSVRSPWVHADCDAARTGGMMRGDAKSGIRGVLSLLHVYGHVRLEVLCYEISWREREPRWRPILAEEGKVLEVEFLGRSRGFCSLHEIPPFTNQPLV